MIVAPSGDHAGSLADSDTRGMSSCPSDDTLTSDGTPLIVAATTIERPSADHAGAPRGSSDSRTMRTLEPIRKLQHRLCCHPGSQPLLSGGHHRLRFYLLFAM